MAVDQTVVDGEWRIADGKMRMTNCGWKNADDVDGKNADGKI